MSNALEAVTVACGNERRLALAAMNVWLSKRLLDAQAPPPAGGDAHHTNPAGGPTPEYLLPDRVPPDVYNTWTADQKRAHRAAVTRKLQETRLKRITLASPDGSSASLVLQ